MLECYAVMRKFKNPVKNIGYFMYRWITPFFDPLHTINSLPNFPGYFKDLAAYSKMKGAEPIKLLDTYPILYEKSSGTPFDAHYFYEAVWAFKKIYATRPKEHIDIASKLILGGLLSVITKVTYVDFHPLKIGLENFTFKKGDILSLPFKKNSISSLSCLNTAEHIGLGRYGDKLDPFGTKKACKELAKVLAPKGNLFFSGPVGCERVCFNAHRVNSPKKIVEYFKDLKLVELSAIDDQNNFIENIAIETLENSSFANGLFWFTKK